MPKVFEASLFYGYMVRCFAFVKCLVSRFSNGLCGGSLVDLLAN